MRWLRDSVYWVFDNIKPALDRHALAMATFVAVAYVLLYVPQIANIVVQLPYDFTRHEDLGVLGFWFFVPLVGLFYYLFWFKLVRESGSDDRQIITFSCVIGGMLLLFASAPRVYFHEVASRWIESDAMLDWLYRVTVVLLVVWYIASWWLLFSDLGRPVAAAGVAAAPPAESLEKLHRDYFLIRLPRLRWATLLLVLMLPLAVVNAFLLLVHYLLCGFWAWSIKGIMGRFQPAQYPKLRLSALPASYALAGGAVYGATEFIYRTTPVVSRQSCLAILIPPLVALLGWTLLLVIRDYRGCAKSPLVGATWRTLILWLTTSLFGEFLWCLPSCPYLSEICSYRLYTIWAAFHLCFGLVALGALADLWHLTLAVWPIRQLTLGIIVATLYFGIRPVPLSPQGTELGSARWIELNERDDALRREEQEAAHVHEELSWYQRLWDRLEHIQRTTDDAGPIVLVAASGGGSRAALFTTLVLEGLEVQEFPSLGNILWSYEVSKEIAEGKQPGAKQDPNKRPARWSDRILLVSSVSGGSLATAHFHHQVGPLRAAGKLQNTFQRELTSRFRKEYESTIVGYYKLDVEARKDKADPARKGKADPILALEMEGDRMKRDFDNLRADPATGLQWMLDSVRADDMCTDFMAPLLRSVLTFRTERGVGVSEFWQQRLGWPEPGRVNNQAYDPKRPLIVFNATDARHGNRFLLGFPSLPRRIATFNLERTQFVPLEVAGAIPAKGARPLYKSKSNVYCDPMRDAYRVDLDSGFSYTFDLERTSQGTAWLDPYLLLEDPQGNLVRYDDDSGGMLNARIGEFKPEASGTYRILAATFGDTPGEYKLTIRKNNQQMQISTRVENSAYDPNVAYTQSLADFSPACRVELAQAVRASANFPWGFQSCYLSRPVWGKGSKADLIRQYFITDHGPDQDVLTISELLPVEFNLLNLDGIPNRSDHLIDDANQKVVQSKFKLVQKVAAADDDTLLRCMQCLENLTKDPHAPRSKRERAARIVQDLTTAGAYVPETETITLLDGGVNDNTGIPTVMEVLQHLEAVAGIADPLIDRKNQELAAKILKRLRERGVIFLEIDSGAQPSTDPTHDLKTPLQGLENAGVSHAVQDRERYLRRIAKTVSVAKPGGEVIPGMIHHRFICNHATKGDALTAWSLGPRDKAHVLATFFCEYQKWRTDQNSALIEEWCNYRNEVLYRSLPRHALHDPAQRFLQAPLRLKAIRDEFRDNDHRRVAQLARIQIQQRRAQK